MAIGANINMIKVSCSFCGRKPDNEKFDSDFWPLYTRYIDSYSNVCICNACKIRHPNAFDFYFSEKEKEPMKVKVRRDEIKEIEIEVDVNELQAHDKFDISKGGEVIATGTVFDAWTGVDGTQRIDATISFKKEGKTWRDLGYDCFEDMIDDIAKRHGSLGRRDLGYNSFEDMIKEGRITSPSNYIKIHDAAHEGKKYVYADSFGKSIIRVINDDGSSTIYDADRFQVYLEEEDD